MKRSAGLITVISFGILLLASCENSVFRPKVLRLHEDVILIDQFGLETCNKPNNQEDEAVFSYHYEIADTSEATNKVAKRLTERDSLFFIDSLTNNLMKAKKYHKSPDSTLWEEYRVLHSPINRKLTVLFRIQEVSDTVDRDIWYHKQSVCHKSKD